MQLIGAGNDWTVSLPDISSTITLRLTSGLPAMSCMIWVSSTQLYTLTRLMHLATTNSSQPHLPILAVNVSSLWHTLLSARRCIGGTPFSVILSVLGWQRSCLLFFSKTCPCERSVSEACRICLHHVHHSAIHCYGDGEVSKRSVPKSASSTDLSLEHRPVAPSCLPNGGQAGIHPGRVFLAPRQLLLDVDCKLSFRLVGYIKLCWKLISSHQVS